ncbi:MAG: c-type cytochrome [Pikeienuella sp.]
MEANKIVAGLVGALLILTGLNFFSGLMFEGGHGDDHHLAYSIEIEGGDGHGDDHAEEEIDLGPLFAAADLGKGEKLFKKCKSCHKIEDGANGTGPHLWNVVNREIGSVAGAKYSGKLPAGESWTAANLFAFLEKPKAFAPGTSMGFGGLKKAEDRAALIAYLNQAGGTNADLN